MKGDPRDLDTYADGFDDADDANIECTECEWCGPWTEANRLGFNGLACPTCGSALIEPDPSDDPHYGEPPEDFDPRDLI
jgi:hypothetical protein